MKKYRMIAKTLFGFEELLADELRQLGASDIELGTRMVSFEGDKKLMYAANLECRTAIKVLKPIFEFETEGEKSLYEGIYSIDWSQYLSPNQTLAVDTTMRSEFFTNSMYVSLKTKDAIVDQFRVKSGVRPSIDLETPDLRINVHIANNHCSVSLDSSGASLHQRGYKTATNIAPINEVLAAGLVLLSGWDCQSDFLDPMCGSGTILAEAAMIAGNIPANIHRKAFGFERWADFDKTLFEQVIEEALAKRRPFKYTITGYDKASSAVFKAIDNIKNAGLQEFVTIKEKDFFRSEKTSDTPLHILFNPPYDERISIDMENFYKDIGATLKRGYANTTAWFITANLDAIKFVGLKATRRIPVFNGQLDARLVRYDMYAGTKRTHFKPETK